MGRQVSLSIKSQDDKPFRPPKSWLRITQKLRQALPNSKVEYVIFEAPVLASLMPPVRLQPVDKALLPDLALAIGEFLLPYRLPLIAQPDQEVLKAAIAEELADLFREATSSKRYVVCAIEVANERSPVGYLLYRLQDESMGLGAAFLLWLQIDPRHQRKGYATAAFESLIRDLRDQRVASLGLESNPANLPAINLFEKLRFGVIREVRWRSLDSSS